MEFRTTTQPFSEDISSSSPEIVFCICAFAVSQAEAALNSSSNARETSQTQQNQQQSQLVDPSIFTLASDSGCFLVLSSCVAFYDKYTSKAHKAMETHRHHRPMVQQCPTNTISAYPHESQVPLCIHFMLASQRAQAGIVQSLVRGCTTEMKRNNVTEQTSEKFTLLLVLAQAIR